MFTTDVYSLKFNLKYNIMIQSDSFIVLNQVCLTDAGDQNGKPKLTPVSADIQPRRNKEQIGYLRDQAIKGLIAECVPLQMLFVM